MPMLTSVACQLKSVGIGWPIASLNLVEHDAHASWTESTFDMSQREDIQPLTRLRRGSTKLLEELQQRQHPVLITRRQREVAVLLTPQYYRLLQEQMRLLTALVQGQAEVTAGDLRPISSLLRDLRVELET